MLYNFVMLNIKSTYREFGFSIAFAFASFIFLPLISVNIGGITARGVFFLLVGGLVGMMIFFLMGMTKLCHGNLLGDCGYLYMTLPVSSFKNVWGRILCGSVWSFLIEVFASVGLLIYINPGIFSGETSVSAQENLLKEAIRKGVPARHIGFICLFVICTAIVAVMILCAAILLSSIVLHSLRLSKAKVPVGILIYAAILGCALGASILQGYLIKLVSVEYLVFAAIAGFAVDVCILVFLVYLSKQLLEKRLEI